eukprot:7376208-Prymnesium_polylepis.1
MFLLVTTRRKRQFWHRASHALHIDAVHLTPPTVAAILQFRGGRGRALPPAGVPEAILPIATGCLAELHIKGVFPRVTCFVQVDLQAFAVRWTRDRLISLHTVTH